MPALYQLTKCGPQWLLDWQKKKRARELERLRRKVGEALEAAEAAEEEPLALMIAFPRLDTVVIKVSFNQVSSIRSVIAFPPQVA